MCVYMLVCVCVCRCVRVCARVRKPGLCADAVCNIHMQLTCSGP